MSDPSSRAASAPADDTGQLVVGATISGRYKVESLLGTGGMGSVYLVQHTLMRKRFALKILNSQTARVPELVARFEREAMASAHVEHPNITVAIDFGKAEDGSFFLVLEYLEGQRLRDALAAGPMDIRRTIHIARQVASALERSHELGIVHRDLKPENIMLVSRQGDRDFVKVLDFGLAKVTTGMTAPGGDAAAQALTKQGSLFGTPKYMAPEQCVSGAIDGRADLYALGLILYEMLAGAHPFASKDNFRLIMHQISTPTPPMKTVAPKVVVPAALEALIMRLTEKEPASRYANAAELLAALAQVAASEGILPPEPAPHLAAPPPRPNPASKEPEDAAQTVLSIDVLSEVATPPAAEPSGAPAATRPAMAAATVGAFKANKPAGKARAAAPLQRVGLWLIVPVVLIGLLLFLVLRSGDPGTSEPGEAKGKNAKSAAAPALAAPAQLEQASALGLPGLLSLAQQFPQDPQVQRAVAHSYVVQKNGVEALRWLAKAAALAESSIAESELSQATTLALSTPESAEAAIALLESDLGARGVDILYTLATRPTQSRIKQRSSLSLAKPEVRAHASRAVLLALDLRAAEQCAAKRALLPRAAADGDQRTLEQLKALLQTRSCGPMGLLDCWPCLRQDTALQSAISSIEARLKPRN